MQNKFLFIVLIGVFILHSPGLYAGQESYSQEELIRKIKQMEIEIEELKREQLRVANQVRPVEYIDTYGRGFAVRTAYGISHENYFFGVHTSFYVSRVLDILVGGNFYRFEREKRWVFSAVTGFLFKKDLYNGIVRSYGGPMLGVLFPEGRFGNRKPMEYFGGVGGIEIFLNPYQSFYLEFGGGSAGAISGTRRAYSTTSSTEIEIMTGIYIQGGLKFYL